MESITQPAFLLDADLHTLLLASLPPAVNVRQTNTTETGSQTVIVQQGDTLGRLAEQFGVGICDIVKASGIEDPNVLTPGQELTIPPPTDTPDDSSCLPPPAPPATETCVLGGPDRLVIPDAGLSAQQTAAFLNITLESFAAANSQTLAANLSAEQVAAANLTGGSIMTVPVCPNSQCTISQGTVQSGDVFDSIAAAAGSTTGQILALNPGIDRLNLQVGQAFTLPSACQNVTGEAQAGNATAGQGQGSNSTEAAATNPAKGSKRSKVLRKKNE